MDVGPAELLIVLVIALVLFGGKKLPELAKSLGLAKKEFEKGARGEVDPDPEPEPKVEPPAPKALEAEVEVEPVVADPVPTAEPTVVIDEAHTSA